MEELFVESHSNFRGRWYAAVRSIGLLDLAAVVQTGYCERTAGQHQRGGEVIRIYGDKLRIV